MLLGIFALSLVSWKGASYSAHAWGLQRFGLSQRRVLAGGVGVYQLSWCWFVEFLVVAVSESSSLVSPRRYHDLSPTRPSSSQSLFQSRHWASSTGSLAFQAFGVIGVGWGIVTVLNHSQLRCFAFWISDAALDKAPEVRLICESFWVLVTSDGGPAHPSTLDFHLPFQGSVALLTYAGLELQLVQVQRSTCSRLYVYHPWLDWSSGLLVSDNSWRYGSLYSG